MRFEGPALSHHANTLKGRSVGSRPVIQEVIQHRIEALFWRVPRLGEVIVDVDFVNRPNRRIGVGVGSQKRPAHPRVVLQGLLEELHAGHPRHPLVDDQEGHRLLRQPQLAERFQCFAARTRPQDAVMLRIPGAEVACDGAQHLRVIVDR